MSVGFGVIGCGRIARAVHIPLLRGLRGASLIGVADLDSAARTAARRVAGRAVVVPDLDSLLDLGVDAVVVATPPASHAQLALGVLTAGRHLYLEKPLATSIDDGAGVVRAAEAAGVVCAMGLNRRHHPAFALARALLADLVLGHAVRVETIYDEPQDAPNLPAWKSSREEGGGALIDLATHHVDLVRHLLGDLGRIGTARRSIRTEDDEGELHARVAGGVPVTIRASYRRPRQDVVRIECERGAIVADRYAGAVAMRGRTVRSRELVALRLRRIARPETEPSYRASLRAFVDRAAGRDVDLPTAADGLAALEAVLATRAIS